MTEAEAIDRGHDVVCLEDDPLDAELLESALRAAVPGLRFRHARTHADFERALAAACPDLVLADYRLPDTDGLVALDRTRELCGDETPFVVVSGVITEGFAIESLKRGATDYVLKQRLQRLGPVARRALAESRMRRELRESRRLALAIGDREQLRLGADLHDAVGQDLAAVALLLDDAQARARTVAPELAGWLADAQRLLVRASQGLRGLSRTLAPVNLWLGGLAPALEQLARDVGTLYAVDCTLEVDRGPVTVEEPVGTHLYRIAQEALTNAAKHGHAKRARIRLERTAQALSVTIEDDGVGIDLARARLADGLGLRLMEYRARMVGARLEVVRGATGGTRVRVVRPTPPG